MSRDRSSGDCAAVAVGEVPAKKQRRVVFADEEIGVEANECMKVFLARCPEEVGSTSCIRIEPFDLNHFFGEDGKIYGHKDLQINVWISTTSFHAYAEVSSESAGRKKTTDVRQILENIFGGSLLEKDAFMESFSKECHFVRETVYEESSVVLQLDDENSVTEVIRRAPHPLLYARLLPLVLLLIEGSTPIEKITDPRWEMLFVVKRKKDSSGIFELLGFATVFQFYRYPESKRLRICQILVLPHYQHQGFGRQLLEAVNSIAISDNVYDVTMEDPSDYLNVVRACMDCVRLLSLEPVKEEIASVVTLLKEDNQMKNEMINIAPPSTLLELAQQNLKIYRKHFIWCWNALILLHIDSGDDKAMANYRNCIYNRLKSEMVSSDAIANGKRFVDLRDDEGSFAMFWSPSVEGSSVDVRPEEANPTEEQLKQCVDEEVAGYAEVAAKVCRAIEGPVAASNGCCPT